ncbi:MAG: APC family permease [Nocardioides sp.]|uniref:APC family permease n=1 Tax=Nocardioides sp. TaxID=35761 RepID=UPI0039E6BC69
MSDHLQRTLGLRSLVLFGLAYMTPMIVLGIFGVVAETTAGASASAYLVALVAMLFTAASYGRMAVAYPMSGSAYTYVSRTIDPRAGFLVGWAILLDYLFLPMVIWLIGGAYLDAQYPDVPFWVWIVGFIALTSALNVLGIKTADRANFALMAMQILVLVLFVALSIGSVVGDHGAGGLISSTPFVGVGATFSEITAGAAIAGYCFLGFDAVSTLSEETIEPKRTVPRAILLVALLGGLIFVAVSYTTQLVHPGGTFADSSSAAHDIALTVGGNLFGAIFLAGLVIAQFASGLAAQASASRLIYAMARDRVLPAWLFGRLHAIYRTPVAAIAAVGAVGVLAIFLDVATSTSFINFGAFTAFTMVNVSAIVHLLRHRDERDGTVAARSWSALAVPVVGAAVTLYLLAQLDSHAIVLGLSWLAVGLLVLTGLTRGFRQPPPSMDFSEEAGEPALGL